LAKKKRRVPATSVKKQLGKQLFNKFCSTCQIKYSGIIKDTKTGVITKTLSCKNSCPIGKKLKDLQFEK